MNSDFPRNCDKMHMYYFKSQFLKIFMITLGNYHDVSRNLVTLRILRLLYNNFTHTFVSDHNLHSLEILSNSSTFSKCTFIFSCLPEIDVFSSQFYVVCFFFPLCQMLLRNKNITFLPRIRNI